MLHQPGVMARALSLTLDTICGWSHAAAYVEMVKRTRRRDDGPAATRLSSRGAASDASFRRPLPHWPQLKWTHRRGGSNALNLIPGDDLDAFVDRGLDYVL
jgi:hypothetical protein